MKHITIVMALFIHALPALAWGLQYVQVVDAATGFEALESDVNAARTEATNTNTELRYDWDENNYLFDGPNPATRIYGGAALTANDNLLHPGVGSQIKVGVNENNTSVHDLIVSVGNNNDEGGGPSYARAMMLWDSADFIARGGSYSFDNTSQSSFSIQSGAAYFNPGGTRYVIRDGDVYYVSSKEGITSGAQGVQYTINGAIEGLKWASFDPADFATFDTDASNLGLPNIGSFTSRTFSNVTGVGFIGETDRASFTRLEVRDFKATLLTDEQDTSLPGYSDHPFVTEIDIDHQSQMPTVSWEAALNQRFIVERSDHLGEWSQIASNYPALGADGNRVSITDPTGSSQGFYRISKTVDPTKKPNILVIIFDDLRDHRYFTASNTIQMPNLDRLASKGIQFNKAYCQGTYCNPSRSSFLTGMRVDTIRTFNNEFYYRDSTNPDIANAVIMPQLFRQNGYYTASLGKVIHGRHQDPIAWNFQQDTHPNPGVPPQHLWNDPTDGGAPSFSWADPDCEDNELDDGALAEHAVEILSTKRNVPFFLALGFHKPHSPFIAPKRYYDLYPEENINVHNDPVDATEAPPLAISDLSRLGVFNAMDQNERRELLRAYSATSTYVDAQLGKVLDAMDELGLWQNTIIVLWSDHGFHQGERGWWGKDLVYDYDAKIPFIAYVPQMPYQNVECDGVIELLDVYPTLADLAGLTPPANLEGESFSSLLADPFQQWDALAFTQRLGGGQVTGNSVCDGRYRFTEWIDGARELYDHNNDPGEWYNLADDPAYSNVTQRLSAAIP